jgi:cellulose synthase/poly-beta-1,6-N-acetylglucosamine synthase-like glycosyltransferase
MTPRYLWAVPAVLGLHSAIVWMVALRRGATARNSSQPESSVSMVEGQLVSILVPAWNEAGTVEKCLSSLERIDYDPVEVIVIAGGFDGTYEVASNWPFTRFPYTVLRQPGGGKNAALAIGFSQARGDIIVILDADSIVERDWLHRLLLALDNDVQAVCGDYHPQDWSWISAYEQMEKIAANQVARPAALQGSGSIAVTRRALDRVGGFPESVKVGVDWDLGVRLLQSGCQLGFAAGANVTTDRPSTLTAFWRNEVRWRRAHLASLWDRRDWYLRNPVAALQSLAFVIMTLTTIAVVAAPLVARLCAPRYVCQVTLVSLAYVGWIGSRRAALAGSVSVFSGDSKWLSLTWAPPVLLFVSMLATLRAALTMSARSAGFKGPRHYAAEMNGSRVDLLTPPAEGLTGA